MHADGSLRDNFVRCLRQTGARNYGLLRSSVIRWLGCPHADFEDSEPVLAEVDDSLQSARVAMRRESGRWNCGLEFLAVNKGDG
jgi:hypothetical protein